jgi:hypothetical protein
VGQEAAHVWGLEHVDSQNDLLFPTTGGAGDPSFEDACHQIVVLDGGIQPTEAACAEMHELNCPDVPDHQNSYQDMMMVFGPRTPDMSPPTLEIVAPTEGETFASGSTVEVRIMMQPGDGSRALRDRRRRGRRELGRIRRELGQRRRHHERRLRRRQRCFVERRIERRIRDGSAREQ